MGTKYDKSVGAMDLTEEDDDPIFLSITKPQAWTGVAILITIAFLVAVVVSALWISPEHQTALSTVIEGIQAAATLLTAAALIAAFAQVRQAKTQLKDSRRWNKMTFALNFLCDTRWTEWEKILEDSFIKVISRSEPLSPEDIKKIFDEEHQKIHLALKSFINGLETYSVAVNTGIAHPEIAKRIYGHKFVAHYRELEPYIIAQRTRQKDNGLFCELELVCKKWRGEFTAASGSY